jgi:hypothetical protein
MGHAAFGARIDDRVNHYAERRGGAALAARADIKRMHISS